MTTKTLDLPASVTQAQCDGPHDPHADSDAERFWQLLGGEARTKMVEEWIASRSDDLRDALFNAIDSRKSALSRQNIFGRAGRPLSWEGRESLTLFVANNSRRRFLTLSLSFRAPTISSCS